jgi:hypothetical protein
MRAKTDAGLEEASFRSRQNLKVKSTNSHKKLSRRSKKHFFSEELRIFLDLIHRRKVFGIVPFGPQSTELCEWFSLETVGKVEVLPPRQLTV